MRLSELNKGQQGIITRVRGRGPFRKRITEMGFIKGKSVTVIKNAPMKDPVEYRLMDSNISLRHSEARLIEVEFPYNQAVMPPVPLSGKGHCYDTDHSARMYGNGTVTARSPLTSGRPEKQSRTIHVALVGNPNSGKTTIFNHASGSRERVGNYSGVTVESRDARFNHRGVAFLITDLPGTYSISAYSPEELFVRNHIIENRPDVVINVIDASNIERNLYLTSQLLEMGVKVVVALNMYDEFQKKGDILDHDALGTLMGIPFVPTTGPTGKGMGDLFDAVMAVHENREKTARTVSINYGPDIEKAILSLQTAMDEAGMGAAPVPSRYAAIKLLEKDPEAERHLSCMNGGAAAVIQQAARELRALESELKEDTETLIADARYGFIAGALRETYRPAPRPEVTASERIDRILTHQVLGFPIFLLFMWLTFQITFTVGKYPMGWIGTGTSYLSRMITAAMEPGLLRELLTDGIIAGIGGVIVFIPSILILFFTISLMEDTGYMARAAFIMDRLMHALGLHGKSFIPLIMGFGCNVPAIMATRTLESRKDRVLTMLIVPFMSCSARLPVYVLFISAFFPGHPGTVLFGMYLLGIITAVLSAVVLKNTFFRKVEAPFVMELPPYRLPRLKNTTRHMWDRGKEYMKKIGGIVLAAAIIIWALGRFPEQREIAERYDDRIIAAQKHYQAEIDRTAQGDRAAVISFNEKMESDVQAIEHAKAEERLEHSYIGMLGRLIEPALAPLGFDWRMSVSIITGLAAKEIAVSTMGILYHADTNSAGGSGSLIARIKEQKYLSGPLAGRPVFDPLTALGYMAFMLLYIPCVATLATMKRESGSWKWPLFSAFLTITLAWTTAFLIRHIGLLAGWIQ
ncbi:MAG TPA: ferrous iron transport protein B [Spirochaetota bacterium]|nr:ferrous iron transport protein B [Spirochaetota bacterium]HQJ72191.1 ferrous iron transport protein B [Spirochaetota bacterium]